MKFRLVAFPYYQEQRDLHSVIREPSRIKGGLKYWVNLGVKTCDMFSLFCMLMLGFGLMVSRLFCFLLFMSSVSLIGFCNEDELKYYWDVICRPVF